MYGAGAKGDGADTFSEQHGSGAQRFFGCFRGGHILFLVQSVHLCVVRANSQLVINIIIEPLFETVALSKFILPATAHERFLSEGLAGPEVFYHTNRSEAGTLFTFENCFVPAWGYNKFCMVPQDRFLVSPNAWRNMRGCTKSVEQLLSECQMTAAVYSSVPLDAGPLYIRHIFFR